MQRSFGLGLQGPDEVGAAAGAAAAGAGAHPVELLSVIRGMAVSPLGDVVRIPRDHGACCAVHDATLEHFPLEVNPAGGKMREIRDRPRFLQGQTASLDAWVRPVAFSKRAGVDYAPFWCLFPQAA